MHILVVNDDGPPSNQSSPYVHSLVKTLQEAGHLVSVCLPHTQRSWIGKAHLVGKTLTPTYYTPGTLHKDDGSTRSRPSPLAPSEPEEWILVDGTPASCVQIGLYHYFQDKGPIDCVISGPNYGRNSTAVFGLSSGTLGGALEAAVCRKKAFAISYAFDSRNHDPEVIAAASKQSVKLVEHLNKNWDDRVDLYSINVPLIEDVEERKILQTDMLQNYWGPHSCFEEAEDETGDANEEEHRIREGEPSVEENGTSTPMKKHKHKHFKWAPRFVDVHKSVEASAPGNDGWAVKNHFTSVTPLRANFMHALPGMEGEIKLKPVFQQISLKVSESSSLHFYAMVEYEDAYVQPLILSALATNLPSGLCTVVPSASGIPNSGGPILHIKSYEELPFEDVMANPNTCLVNAYAIRKALIRKNYLSNTVQNWIAKNSISILTTNIKPSCDFELDYAEFLDDALVEAWELNASFQRNEGKEPSEREWWILKPGMSDRGQGIRLFSTEEELRAIFEGWEADLPDSDDEEGNEGEDEDADQDEKVKSDSGDRDYIMTSQLRHFVAQPYIHPPLLLSTSFFPDSAPRKFHIRTYVLAVGAIKVYIYRPMLALFAEKPYVPPWSASSPSSSSSSSDVNDPTSLKAHLTNTCLQNGTRDGSVLAFWSLPSSFSTTTTASTTQPPPEDWKSQVFTQICALTGEIFEAAARSNSIHFQPLPNAFEVFGLDFLVDGDGKAWLLEVNAFPDFRQTGEELKMIIKGLWEDVVEYAVKPFFGVTEERDGQREKMGGNMVLVREIDLGRR